MKKYFCVSLLTSFAFVLFGQSSEELKLPERKRLIDRVEVFAGPGFSLNYGNKFIENYQDSNIRNKRLPKFGYTAGVGIYHPISYKTELRVRILFEQKGTKSELNNPLNAANDDARLITRDNYTYDYYTLCGSTIFYLGNKKRWQVSLGAYYSKAKNLRGESESHNTRDFQVNSGSFEGRYFYHLRQDGGMDGFSWMPYLASIENHDWGLVTSIGYVIPIRHHAVLFQLQDNLGLTNINKNNPYDLEERNHSILLTFSYIFKFPPNPSHL